MQRCQTSQIKKEAKRRIAMHARLSPRKYGGKRRPTIIGQAKTKCSTSPNRPRASSFASISASCPALAHAKVLLFCLVLPPELLQFPLPPSLDGVCTSAPPPTTTCCRISRIQPHCSNSTADARRLGSLSKHLLKKLRPSSLNWSFVGICGGLPCAMLYMIAHSLSSEAQGRRPVHISRITQPSDQTSMAP